jgi:transposase
LSLILFLIMRGADLSNFNRGLIYGLHFVAHWSYPNISRGININMNTIKQYCSRVKQGESQFCNRKLVCGRKLISSATTDNAILRASEADRFKTATEIQRNLRCLRNISVRTVRRRLQGMKMKAWRPAKKCKLTARNKELRFQWATIHLQHGDHFWGNVVFTDEKTFFIGNQHHQYVRRHLGERYRDDCILERANRSVAKVNIWAGFSLHGSTELVLLPGRMNSLQYIDVLRNNLIPRIPQLLPTGGFVMQDNAPIHTARTVTEFLNNNNVPMLQWPPITADANIIENVWAYLETHVNKVNINNSENLFQRLQTCWQECMSSLPFRRKLVESVKDRISAIHRNEGGHTRF